MTPEPTPAPGSQTPDQVREAFKDSLLSGLRDQCKGDIKLSVDAAQTIFNEKMAEFEGRMLDYEARSRAGYVPGSHEAGSKETIDMGRVVKSLVMRQEGCGEAQWRAEAPYEWECADQARLETRDQSTSPDTAGGFLVPGQFFDDQIIPLLRPKLIAQELGAMDLPVTSTPVEIPREGTSPTVEALAENEAGTSADVAFGMVQGTPHTAQSFIRASRRFLTMGTGADVFLRRRMTDEIALEINRWALLGTGASNEPIGILNAAGVGSVTSATSFEEVTTYASLIEMEGQVDDANAMHDGGSMGWAIANAGFRALRQIQSEATNAAHVSFSRKIFSDPAEAAILGHPFKTSTQLTGGGTTTHVVFGDWGKMVIPRWGTVVVEASNTANDALQSRQTHIVAYMDVDVMILQPTAFSTWVDGDSTGF